MLAPQNLSNQVSKVWGLLYSYIPQILTRVSLKSVIVNELKIETETVLDTYAHSTQGPTQTFP